uniref:protein-serine/threonine phosphatase n=1 Tax=Oryza punctata TaxID=4537 RepID=A0A0E0LC65_ORYPU
MARAAGLRALVGIEAAGRGGRRVAAAAASPGGSAGCGVGCAHAVAVGVQQLDYRRLREVINQVRMVDLAGGIQVSRGGGLLWRTGHGGPLAAEYLKEHLFENLLNHPEFLTDTKLAISQTFLKTDADFLESVSSNPFRDDGSTAVTAILVGNNLYVANVGDSRVVALKAGKAVPLSEDHKPNRKDEQKRIEDAGDTWRVNGLLAMSRAFGNRALKHYVKAEPEIQEKVIDEGLEYLILATDGLWDVMRNEDAVSLLKAQDEPKAAAIKLTEVAHSRLTLDNITCIVLQFHHGKSTSSKEPKAAVSASAMRRHHLLGLLRRAAASSTSAASIRVAPHPSLHAPDPLRNGGATPRCFSSRGGGEDEVKLYSLLLGLSSDDEGEAFSRGPAASRGGQRTRKSKRPPPRSRFDGDGVGCSKDGKLSWGYSSFKGRRPSMEDRLSIKSTTVNGQTVGLFGVFDGSHGGPRAAEYLKKHLFKNLVKHPMFLKDTKLAINQTFLKTDADFLQSISSDRYRDDGSTAVAAILVGNRLYVANVGDSRAVALKAGKAVPLSEDHKPNRKDERKRIEDAGGIVVSDDIWRVDGILAVSRAFGNRALKRYVKAEPDIQENVGDEGLEYLVLATDGLWDVMRNEDAVSLLKAQDGPKAAAMKLTEVAPAAKSLIEDEAELSDWISDLKTDSFHLGLSSGDEGEASTRGPAASRGGRRGRDSRGPPPRSRFGGDDFGGGGRGFERRGRMVSNELGDDDDDEDEVGFGSARGRRERGGRQSEFSHRGRRGNDRGGRSSEFSYGGRRGNDFDDDGGGFRSTRGQRGRGGRLANVSRRGYDFDDESGFQSPKGQRGRGGRYSDLDDDEGGFGSPRGRHGRGGRMSGISRRGGRGSDLDDSEESENDSIDSRGSSRRHDRGTRGRNVGSLGPRRGGRRGDADFSDRRSRGGKMFDFGTSEDDSELGEVDEDDGPSGFEDDLFDDEGGEKDLVKSPAKNSAPFESIKRESVGQEDAVHTRESGGGDSYLSQTRFDECSLSPLTLKGVKAAGYERMTAVQEATLPIILKGKDVLAKAKTGTGKTVAFLLPAIEVVSKLPPIDRDQKRTPISVVVVCPTRELADQAAAEANKLLKFHPSIGVQLVIGGTRMALEQKRMHTNPCQILVATPGRLKDHMENTPGFATRLMGVKVLILDEADRLLDMGFRTDIERIVAALPKQRQTLLFSATVPDEVRQVCHIAMKRDLEFVNTVEEGSEETHSQVKQMHVVAPLDKQFSIMYGLLTDHISENVDYKVIVFCTTAKVTSLVAELLSELKLNVREIHSRKPQSYRTRISKEFKESKGLILVSSDVSARGVDYPNVTLVVQMGVPTDREQYIHRLGRTGRRGNEGSGILLLAPWEEYFLRSIKDLPITEATLPLIDLDTKRKVEKALAHVEVKDKELAYQAWLGYYNSNKFIGRDKYQLVSLANEFSRSLGLNNPPAVPKLVLRKMGLNNIPGLRSK